ncbi:RNA polymerase sigma-70 factor (ECF subfamily) [Arcticibacter pallidicorallinus]|uniref:RNA polymerase sigma-70 factor (ECF subfamily) n=1 Tax=Arcticibacter pallidicorallinus TaxID=1259464 RepID=A0A2T0U611_9SPHI|nr:sigma-70 family RNA polymerase sigma factor [Arcticibacter pallidicorallinus]PRY53308.1 RNA polymerase sigma-70 factor (ECF subfamily) [Arcticibacter pallidicorallinus]
MEDKLEDAFIRQINQNIGIAHKVCNLYFNDSQDREDLIQEMLYQLWRGYPGFQGNAKFSTWMYKVCLNTALTNLRRSKRTKSESISDAHNQIPDESTGEQERDISMLHKLLDKLSPLNKSIVLLYLEDLQYDEISGITGLSRANISVRLVRIKNELRKFKQHNL